MGYRAHAARRGHRRYYPWPQHLRNYAPKTKEPLFTKMLDWAVFLVPLFIVLAVIAAFAGVQPLATYKNEALSSARQYFFPTIAETEQSVLDKVNVERLKRGAQPLVMDSELAGLAKAHSEEMDLSGTLFHSSEDMLYAENVLGSPGTGAWSASEIVDGWMGSDEHRTWLLCPDLVHVGVGISADGRFASWTFWRSETTLDDWWYQWNDTPPSWWN